MHAVERQVPSGMQVSVAVHCWQRTPPVPQPIADETGWHIPFAQQPEQLPGPQPPPMSPAGWQMPPTQPRPREQNAPALVQQRSPGPPQQSAVPVSHSIPVGHETHEPPPGHALPPQQGQSGPSPQPQLPWLHFWPFEQDMPSAAHLVPSQQPPPRHWPPGQQS